MERFTGQKDTDVIILHSLDDKDLGHFCSTNQYIKTLCDDDLFWRDRIVKKYGKDTLQGFSKADHSTYREFYTTNKAKSYTLCRLLESIPHSSQLVIDDFYSSTYGIISRVNPVNIVMIDYLILKIVLEKMAELNNGPLEREDRIIGHMQMLYRFMPAYQTAVLNVNSKFLTNEEREIFKNSIDFLVERPKLLKRTAMIDPKFVRSLSPRPEDKFLLITYIHDGFRNGSIPLDILWSELCTSPYVLKFFSDNPYKFSFP